MAGAKVAAVVATLLVVTACGSSSPTSPAPAAVVTAALGPIQPGTWKGAFEITSCTATGRYSSCKRAPTPFTLRLTDAGMGVLVVDTSPWTAETAVTATQRGGLTVVAGSSSMGEVSFDVEIGLTQMSATLEGTAHYTMVASGSLADYGQFVSDARILFAERDNTVYPGRLHGRWVGRVERTACSGDCSWLDPLLRPTNYLTLSQVGTEVTGWFNLATVKGSVNGATLTASAYDLRRPDSCYSIYDGPTGCVTDVTITATVDKLERLSGSISYKVEGVIYGNFSYAPRYAFTATAMLTELVRRP